MSTDQEQEEERIQREIEGYLRILRTKKDRDRELSEESKILQHKAVSLSNLRSPISNSRTTSSNELDSKLKYCVDCIIEYGRRTLP